MATVTQTLDATDEYVSFGPSGPFTVCITGTWTGTLTLRVTDDDSTWSTVKEYTSNPTPPTERVNTDRGLGMFQVYATSISNGSATVTMRDV